MKQNLPNIDADITVLFKSSNKDYERGYTRLIEKNSSVNFIRETEFKTNFVDFLKNNIDEYVMLLTYDSVFYKQFNGTDHDIKLMIYDNSWCFSFRLGLNTTTQWYLTGSQQQHLSILGYTNEELRGEKYIKWNWKVRPPFENYGYMMSWDGHIYKAADLLNLALKFTFYNPRTFEDKATKIPDYRREINKKYMVSRHESCLFVNTINAVQEEPPEFGSKYTHSVEDLNNRYLSGEIISMDSFKDLELNSSHDEIPLRFKCN